MPDDFPAIPGIDRVRATHTLGGDRAFFLRLLEGFLTQFTDAVAQTRQDLARGERQMHGRYLSARSDFESLEPALRGVLGEAKTDALARAIRGLRYQEALKLLVM